MIEGIGGLEAFLLGNNLWKLEDERPSARHPI
jgi:hypothetical protein